MKPRTLDAVSICFGLVTLTVLGYLNQSQVYPPEFQPILWWLFTILTVLTAAFGIPLGGGDVSITPMITLTAALVIGVVPAAWTVVCGELLYGLARYAFPKISGWSREEGTLNLIGSTAANIAMHGLSVLAAGFVFFHFQGTVPAPSISKKLVLIGAAASYIMTNYLLASIFIGLRGKAHLTHLWKNFPRLLIYEAVPIIFVPLTAQIYLVQGWTQFILFAISLTFISFILRDQANTHKNLQRRIQELGSLQAVGQALSSSLNVDTIIEAIYSEVSKLMPASNFYVALVHPDTGEVSFPIVYEHDLRAAWEPRLKRKGLTEYVIDTRQPLLIQKNVKETVTNLGIQHLGAEALSWLGVPILAGGTALGMIAVQSYPQPDKIGKTFDQSHLEVLQTIAGQASVAIQNARLYAQTDHALTLRLQELSSILSTTKEGIILLDDMLRVVQANRTISILYGEPVSSILGRSLTNPEFSQRLGFQSDQVVNLLGKILMEDISIHRDMVQIWPNERKTYERAISPVVDEKNSLSGWLLVFRDITEEIHLSQLREDLTRMLVHDLRSPLVSIQGGLDLIESMLKGDEPKEEMLEMLEISRHGGQQLLGMINELLSIHHYESGQLILNLEPVALPDLCNQVADGFSSLLQKADLKLNLEFEPYFPILIADKELLRRLIHNLIDNAVKFTPDGGQIEIWGTTDKENEKKVLFGVKDNGYGVSPEIQPMLFQKYFISTIQKSRRKGTGIGLYFSQLAVHTHGGEIWVESEPGKGSNFKIRLPVEAQPTTRP